MIIQSIENPGDLIRFDPHPALPPFDPRLIVRHGADAHRIACAEPSQMNGRCSLWWKRTPVHAGHRVGLIGHYAATDAAAAGLLLVRACADLAANGCTLAVGPMDGNTWRNYRLVTESTGEPPFFLEPRNPSDWPRHFGENGFATLADYVSASTTDLAREDPKTKPARQRLETLGVRLRALDGSRLDRELASIYGVASVSFRGALLYFPMLESEFTGEFHSLLPFLRPELVWIAEHEGRTVGFIFALPDAEQAASRQPVDTAIIKTIAVLPDRNYRGLGAWLTLRCHQAARESGYRKVIHALMRESNPSRNISARYASIFRRYTLFAKPL